MNSSVNQPAAPPLFSNLQNSGVFRAAGWGELLKVEGFYLGREGRSESFVDVSNSLLLCGCGQGEEDINTSATAHAPKPRISVGMFQRIIRLRGGGVWLKECALHCVTGYIWEGKMWNPYKAFHF